MYNAHNAGRIVEVARTWLNTPYQHQASLRGVGCDCLGLIRGIWRQVEGEEPEIAPPYSSTWSDLGEREHLLEIGNKHFFNVDVCDAQPADLLMYRMRRNSVAKHVAVISGTQRIIHAYSGACVIENELTDFWKRRIAGAFRFPSVHSEANS